MKKGLFIGCLCFFSLMSILAILTFSMYGIISLIVSICMAIVATIFAYRLGNDMNKYQKVWDGRMKAVEAWSELTDQYMAEMVKHLSAVHISMAHLPKQTNNLIEVKNGSGDKSESLVEREVVFEKFLGEFMEKMTSISNELENQTDALEALIRQGAARSQSVSAIQSALQQIENIDESTVMLEELHKQ